MSLPLFVTGIYIQMVVKVSADVFKFLGLYASVIFGFALSFHVVYASHLTLEYFGDPLTSILATLAMMVGEFNFADLFVPSQVLPDILAHQHSFS